MEVLVYHPWKIFQNTVQICAIWCIFGDHCNRKCTTQCLIKILGDQYDDIGSSKVAHGKSALSCATFKSDTEFVIPAI